MYDRTLAIYCFVDDLLKAMQHREDARCEVSDSEVVTLALCAMLWFGGNFERSRSFLPSPARTRVDPAQQVLAFWNSIQNSTMVDER